MWMMRRSSVWPPPHVACNLLLIIFHNWALLWCAGRNCASAQRGLSKHLNSFIFDSFVSKSAQNPKPIQSYFGKTTKPVLFYSPHIRRSTWRSRRCCSPGFQSKLRDEGQDKIGCNTDQRLPLIVESKILLWIPLQEMALKLISKRSPSKALVKSI